MEQLKSHLYFVGRYTSFLESVYTEKIQIKYIIFALCHFFIVRVYLLSEQAVMSTCITLKINR